MTESLNEDDEQLEQTYGAPYFVARFEPDWVVMRPYEWTVVESVFPKVAAQYRLVRRFESELDADIYQGGYGIHNLDTEFLVFRRNPYSTWTGGFSAKKKNQTNRATNASRATRKSRLERAANAAPPFGLFLVLLEPAQDPGDPQVEPVEPEQDGRGDQHSSRRPDRGPREMGRLRLGHLAEPPEHSQRDPAPEEQAGDRSSPRG